MKQIAENLKVLRELKDLSVKELSIFLGISERSYRRYEAGERVPTIDVLLKLAKYYEVKVDDLVSESGTKDLDLSNMISYRDIIKKGYNSSLAHGLIKEVLSISKITDYELVEIGINQVKFVKKEQLKVLLDSLVDNFNLE